MKRWFSGAENGNINGSVMQTSLSDLLGLPLRTNASKVIKRRLFFISSVRLSAQAADAQSCELPFGFRGSFS